MIKENQGKLIFMFTNLILIALLVSASFTQLAQGTEYKLNLNSTLFLNQTIQSERGLILDRNGNLLADNKKVYDIFFNSLGENAEQQFQLLKTDLEKVDLNTEVEFKQNSKIRIFRNLSETDFQKSNFIFSEYAVEVIPKYIRNYYHPEVLSHIIGYTSQPSEEDLANGYSVFEMVGEYRIESDYEEYLRGLTIQSKNSYQGIPGNNLKLTIDLGWQKKLYDLLEEYSSKLNSPAGAAVFLNSDSGEVMAQVSYPGFDTNLFVDGISEGDLAELSNNRGLPLTDKAISQAFEPGSTLKIATAYSLLKNKTISQDSTIFSNRCLDLGGDIEICEFGRNFYGTLNLSSALARSSNIYFCNYSINQSLENNSLLSDDLSDLGLGKATGLDISGESAGFLDSPENKRSLTGEGWFSGDTCNMSIGQGRMLVTPMQMAAMQSRFINNGGQVKPKLIKEISEFNTDKVQEFEIKFQDELEIDKNILNAIDAGLSDVSYSNISAISPFFRGLENLNLKSKTGTAEAFEQVNEQFIPRAHGWIVGRFDYEGENYSFAIFMQYGQGGFEVSQILSDFLKFLNDR